MRVLLATDSYPPMPDGVATATHALAHGLQRMGHDVLVLAPKTSPSSPCYRCPPTRRYRALRTTVADYPLVLLTSRAIGSAISDFSPDVINIHSLAPLGLRAGAYARRFHIPRVLTWHTDVLAYRSAYPLLNVAIPTFYLTWNMHSLSFRAIYRALSAELAVVVRRDVTRRQETMLSAVISSFDKVVAPSQQAARRMPSVPEGNIAIVASSPIKARSPLTTDDQLRLQTVKQLTNKRRHIICYIGRISAEKNFRLLLDCMKEQILPQDPTAVLLAVGPVRNQRSTTARIRNLDLVGSVELVGSVPNCLIPYILDECMVLALPSRTETQGLVLSEAALAGVPSVTVDPSLDGIVRHEQTGLVAEDPSAFGNSLVRIIADPCLRKRLGQAAKSEALSYTEVEFASRMERILRLAIITDSTGKIS